MEPRLLELDLRAPKFKIELQQRVCVVKRRATRRWKALMPYFKMVVSKKYVHTTGTLYAHIRHSEKHHFDMSFEKNIDVPLVCMMYKKCSYGF